LFTTNPIRTDPRGHPGLHGEKLATALLSDGKVILYVESYDKTEDTATHERIPVNNILDRPSG
jgi:hypothetical protein